MQSARKSSETKSPGSSGSRPLGLLDCSPGPGITPHPSVETAEKLRICSDSLRPQRLWPQQQSRPRLYAVADGLRPPERGGRPTRWAQNREPCGDYLSSRLRPRRPRTRSTAGARRAICTRARSLAPMCSRGPLSCVVDETVSSTAKSCQGSSMPRRRCVPRSMNFSPEPATRSRTVLDARTSPPFAIAAIRAPT
jgi:hypothetical protein